MMCAVALAVGVIVLAAPSFGLVANTAGPRSPATVSGAPDAVDVYVHVQRVRSLSMQDHDVRFAVLIDGQDSLWWAQTFSGMDISIEWPLATRTVAYEPGKEIPIQIGMFRAGMLDQPCDISGKDGTYDFGKTLTVFYNLTTGEWHGDDYLGDPSGYGHATGFEDGNYDEDDYEIWFDIYQLGDSWHEDRLTYWDKLSYGLDPAQEYGNEDLDNDGVPSDWEDTYGYSPVSYDPHATLDDDRDGLNNIEEYQTSQWFSDPAVQDVFVEVDGMQAQYPWQEDYTIPEESLHLICNEYTKHGINLHYDTGNMGGGGDLIPFDAEMWGNELMNARLKYFLDGDSDNWRRGVFHYALICCQMGWNSRPAGGRMVYAGYHTVGCQYVRNWRPMFILQGNDYVTAFASVFMHEQGHTLGLYSFEGIDNESSRFPWNPEYWEWGPYHSCMNYRYVYKYVGYSDGDDTDHDQDDWAVIRDRMDEFQEEW
jgi:hypothetical protein